MAILTYSDIDLTRRDAESPVTEQLLLDYWTRDEAHLSGPVDLRWPEVSHTTSTFTQKAAVILYLPGYVGTDGGTKCVLRVVFEAKVTAGTGEVRLTLGSGTPVVVSLTGTVYARYEAVIAAADVNAVRAAESTLKVELRMASGTGTIYAQNVWSASRIERNA